MNKIFLRKSVFSLSLAAISLLSSSLSTSAQTTEKTIEQQFVQSNRVTSKQENQPVEHFSSNFADQKSEKPHLLVNPELLASETYTQKAQIAAPVPGTTVTSSAALANQSQQASSHSEYPQANRKISDSSQLAQADIDFGGPTRGGSSYVGVAGNIGLGGESALGDGNFMVISKFGLTDILSVRPSVVLGDDTVILVPLTYDFSFKQVADPFREPLPFSPYAGAGLAYATGDDSELTFLLTGGVDVPINDKLTATATVNAAFFDETDLGLSVGVGYNFGGF